MKETLFFDYDGTLVELWSLKDRFKMVLDSLYIKYNEATFEAAYRDFEEYLKINKYNFDGELNLEVYNNLWYGAADKAAERLSLDEKGRLYKKLDEIASSDKPFPETREVIESLHDKGYNLSIITNNFWDIGKKLDNLKLSPYFDSVVSHFEAKAMKPDKKIFELALTKAKARPDDSIMIGDSLEDDFYGAMLMGIEAILVDRKDENPSINPRIKDLRGLFNDGLIIPRIRA